jgi:hypothetical protein
MYTPIPDIVYRPTVNLNDIVETETIITKSLPSETTDVEMRLLRVFVKDKRDIGKGEIYLFTVTTDSIAPEPFKLELKTFRDVENNTELTFGPGGLTIYRNPQGNVPRFLDYRIFVMESDQGIRDAGKFIGDVQGNSDFISARDSIVSAVTGNALTGNIIISATDVIVSLISKILKINKDDQLILIAGSFNDKIDDLGTKYGNIFQETKYSSVNYQVLFA